MFKIVKKASEKKPGVFSGAQWELTYNWEPITSFSLKIEADAYQSTALTLVLADFEFEGDFTDSEVVIVKEHRG